ncbi:MAG: bifunctional salicylyl-CoA 5-hydroxylase/oxidoreductase [Planctomycetota bacterium]
MRIASLGGGPAGLYFSILMKKAFPDARITVYERNQPDDTFGWGVVFSDETLGNFEAADPESFAEIRRNFAYWSDIETFYGDTCVRSTGHGFCGLSRKKLLQIFHARCKELGVDVRFQHDVKDDAEVADADLILAADGINSFVRAKYAEHFQPSLDWRTARFCWLGTTKPLKAFTFIFRENEHGLFQIHAYPFEANLSTFIVETHEDTWKRAGLDKASDAETVAYCKKLFADHLDGHELLTNRSIWRAFPTVKCERWHHGKIVLMGDAVHTAHFSIGSGTKLAMEDAIALADAFKTHGTKDVPKVLAAYESARKLDVLKTQKAAQTSLEWFENSRRYQKQHPLQFTFNLMTRSKRITYDNLGKRDPELVKKVTDWYGEANGLKRGKDGTLPPPMFAPLTLRGCTLENRVVVSPMCQYSAVDGVPNDWHVVHLGSRAIGGAGLVIAEATGVAADGRISPGCTGLWNTTQRDAWKRIVDFAHAHSRAKIAIQIGHAGRKASCSVPWEGDAPLRDARAWPTLGPSAQPFKPDWHVPRAMERADFDRITADFVRSAKFAHEAGFDVLELHMAHGYLLSSFLSPLANQRTDAYGGSLAKRMRFPLDAFDAVRAVWPKEKPLFVRISASDWLDADGGQTIADSVEFAKALKAHGCDLVDVSSGGNSPKSRIDYGRMYQVPFAERIRYEAELPVMAVGAIQGADHVNTVLAAGRADLCALARPHLFDPYLTRHAAATYGHFEFPWPNPYLAVKPRPRAAGDEG